MVIRAIITFSGWWAWIDYKRNLPFKRNGRKNERDSTKLPSSSFRLAWISTSIESKRPKTNEKHAGGKLFEPVKRYYTLSKRLD